MKRFLLLAAALLCLTSVLISCEEGDKPTPVAVFVTPELSKVDTITSGSHKVFTVKMYSRDSQIKRLQVQEISPSGLRTVVDDDTFNERECEYLLDYEAPQLSNGIDSANVTLKFTAWDNTGASNQVERTVVVRNGQVLVGEYTGIVLHRGKDGLADALNLARPTQPFKSWEFPDDVDLMVVADEDYQALSFTSNTQTRFVKYNDFNYPAATINSIQTIFESSKLSYQVGDIHINDIIIVGHEKAQGVFFVSNIVRSGAASEKSVQLNYKMISPR